METAEMQFANLKRVEEKYNVRLEYVNLTWNGIMESINTFICALTGRGRRVSTFLIPTSCHGKCHSTGYCKRGCLSDFAVKHILPPILYLPQRTQHLCAMSPASDGGTFDYTLLVPGSVINVYYKENGANYWLVANPAEGRELLPTGHK